MYNYKCNLRLANENATDVQFTDYAADFRGAVEAYNDASRNAKNPKQIVDYDIQDKNLIIELQSRDPLSVPNLALQGFSKHLVKNSELASYTKGAALFRGEAEEISHDEAEEISDDELLLEVIRLFRRSNTSENRNKIEQIRAIIGK